MRQRFNPATSLLAGRSDADLRADLATAQQALLDLQSGNKVITVSYSQGSGNRSVSYSQTDLASLQNTIRQLQLQLGIIPRGRQPIRVVF